MYVWRVFGNNLFVLDMNKFDISKYITNTSIVTCLNDKWTIKKIMKKTPRCYLDDADQKCQADSTFLFASFD